jgi:surface carbohydrate biosynthesis protein
MILYIPIELPKREFVFRMDLAKFLLESGKIKSVLIIEHLFFEKIINYIPVGVIFYKDFSPWRAEPILRKAKRLGFSFAAIDEEGLYFYDESLYRSRVSAYVLKNADLIFFFGRYQFGALKTSWKDSYIYSGSYKFPAIELLNSDKSIKNPLKILLNTKFTTSSYLAVFSAVFRGLRLNFKFGIRVARLSIQELSYDRKMSNLFIELSRVLLSHGYSVTIRPHPNEDVRKYPNEITSSQTLEEDFNDNDVVIHSGCTTGLEALSYGKPVIAYKPIPSLTKSRDVPNIGSITARTHIDVLNLLENGQIINQANSSIVSSLYNLQKINYSIIDNSDPKEVIGKAIENISFGSSKFPINLHSKLLSWDENYKSKSVKFNDFNKMTKNTGFTLQGERFALYE